MSGYIREQATPESRHKALEMQNEVSRNLSGRTNVDHSYALPLLSAPDKVDFRSLA
jgi:hypothetical protein